MTNALHLPPVVEHAAHEVVHQAGAVTHQVGVAAHHLSATARHEADVVVDVLLSPLSPALADFHVEITEDDIL
jgi:hypothetical protein